MRIAAPLVAFLLLAAFTAVTIAADEAAKSRKGTVVSVESDKIVMTGEADGKEMTHQVESSARITLDGKEAKLDELKKDDKVTVTTDEAGKVTTIKASRSSR